MRNNLTIRGGFAGFETSADQREFAAPTILSGSNARRIFFNSGLDSSAVVESVTFSEGFADMGGAVYNDNLTSAKFINCNFKNNSAATNGGAVFNNNSSAYFERCIFEKTAQPQTAAEPYTTTILAPRNTSPASLGAILDTRGPAFTIRTRQILILITAYSQITLLQAKWEEDFSQPADQRTR